MLVSNLKPAAIAALCCLRSGQRTAMNIRNCVGDLRITATYSLLADLHSLQLVASAGAGYWHLTYDGIGWLATRGLEVSAEARISAQLSDRAVAG